MGDGPADPAGIRPSSPGSQAGRDTEEINILFQAGQLKISGPLLADLKMVAKARCVEPAALALLLLEYAIDQHDAGKIQVVNPLRTLEGRAEG